MFRVTPDKTHDNSFFLSSLKPVHASQFDAVESLFQRTGYQTKLETSVYFFAWVLEAEFVDHWRLFGALLGYLTWAL